MADKHSLNYDVRELKLGTSFTNNRTSQYHTIKYDFKPASVDVNKMATVDVGTNNQVTVTVPHLDGAGVPQTVFRGSQRPYAKECVLIIDRDTGEITLEKLSSNIQVKKTRQENSQKPRPLTPQTAEFTNTTQRSTSRTRVATNRRSNTGNPAVNAAAAGAPQATNQNRFNNAQKPQNMVRSPPRVKTSPPQAPWSAGGNSTLASLPMIGFEDAQAAAPPPAPHVPSHVPHVSSHVPHVPPHVPPHVSSHVPHVPPHVPPHVSSHAPHVPHLPSHVPHVPLAPPNVPPSLPSLPSLPSHAPPPNLLQAQPVQRNMPPPSAPRQDDSSSSSSSDSDSGSGSDSDSDDNDNDSGARPARADGAGAALHTDVLQDDLCLSESESDFD